MVGPYRLKEHGLRLPAGAHVLPTEAVEALEAADALVRAAQARAAEIESGAQAAFEAERLRGYEEGLRMARLEAIERLLGETHLLDEKLAEIEAHLTEIVIAAVRRLVQGFDDAQKAESIVRLALGQMRRETKAELRVSPELHEPMRARVADILKDFPEIKSVDVVEDMSLEGSRVVVETAIGRVDGDIGRSLDELGRALRRAGGPGTAAPILLTPEAE
ncbi:type III secretion system stator protein SctL [Antarcticirhabdus aurantiaca]|uniref:Type III secretion system stator protein SctL n=1 Tax=Antarcticirhabdus aurantiaca TaxID=2606717 RepID=A0ACD4NUJ2_9HYPH|nr:type III secretion system stator protein SctL [Antarcticirhabdus aurantiaca]WAJ30518.1 type III secretion system stator protein SctL [Jeongeuplla avenae]